MISVLGSTDPTTEWNRVDCPREEQNGVVSGVPVRNRNQPTRITLSLKLALPSLTSVIWAASGEGLAATPFTRKAGQRKKTFLQEYTGVMERGHVDQHCTVHHVTPYHEAKATLLSMANICIGRWAILKPYRSLQKQ